ncbi:MAG TPA: DUF4097 family beta strand repeat-containing protein, partial [Pyrinomonadaceae bacterium]|nr:DUF4097 family beta strand repeat-containing protein [Pyrinomonadaceae bacterium]
VEGDVKASSINGKVAARGLMGITRLSTVNGSLDATFSKLEESKPITLGSVNGNVLLVIPSDTNAIVRAGTVHGGISNDFGLEVQHGDYVGHELYGQLGTGGPRVRLENVNGRITIRHAQDGRPLSPATCLLPEKKDKDKAKYDEEREEERERQREERQEQLEAMRAQREAQAEAQREIERSLRESQRELERAQREIQREVRREVREHVRRERGEGEGRGVGRGSGHKTVTQRESKSFTVSGSPRVNIMTFDGPIKVHGWDKSEVSYTATKQGSDEEELKLIDIQTEQQGAAVSIIAKSEEDTGAASLEVYVPRKTTLHVSSEDGQLDLEGVSGDLTLRTSDGPIKVSNGRGQLKVNTGDGEIRITNFEGQVDARTGDGPISIDGSFSGLAARTGDGPITLSVPSNANFTIETDAEGIDNSGLTVSEDFAPSGRVRRWKVGGGGNVFVLSTGEGRIMLRPR